MRLVTIRPFRPGDEERIAELSRQLGYPSTAEDIRRRMEPLLGDADHAVFVADLPDLPAAGWVHVFRLATVESDARAEIGGLVVDEACRRSGVGRRLMERAEAWARERNCATVSLRSNVIRDEAHRFYRELGYSVVKTQHAFRKSLRENG
jgi:GNAT superfamily N-acetyltransferase